MLSFSENPSAGNTETYLAAWGGSNIPSWRPMAPFKAYGTRRADGSIQASVDAAMASGGVC